MTRPLAEYTVRDYSAVDRQVEQIAERERQYTEKLKIRNYRQMTILCVGALLAFGLFLVLTAIAYRIAFPPKIEVIETTKVIEKTVTPKITIETPVGSAVNEIPQTPSNVSITKTKGLSRVTGQDADNIIRGMDDALAESNVNNSASDPYITLTWNNLNDLDLVVDEPNGNRIYFGSPQRKLDIDANKNKGTASRRPVENISWPENQVLNGRYKISVIFFRRDHREPISGQTQFNVRIKNSDSEEVIRGKFTNSTKSKSIKEIAVFEVAAD